MTVRKSILRQELRQRMATLGSEVRAARSAAACRLLCAQDEYRRADVVMLFLAGPEDVDARHVALQAWADGKTVLAPRVSWDQRRMMPVEIQSLVSGVEARAMGIREPVDGMPAPIADIDLVVVPGLGFDSAGNRLGRGRGFYDRFLSHPEYRGVSCGLGLEEQVVETIPVGPSDVRIDMLVTDVTVRRFSA